MRRSPYRKWLLCHRIDRATWEAFASRYRCLTCRIGLSWSRLSLTRKCTCFTAHFLRVEYAPYWFSRNHTYRAWSIYCMLSEYNQACGLPWVWKNLLVNGHGSNYPLVDLIARKTVLATESLCFASNYFKFLLDAFNEIKESDVMAHADEFETSLYL